MSACFQSPVRDHWAAVGRPELGTSAPDAVSVTRLQSSACHLAETAQPWWLRRLTECCFIWNAGSSATKPVEIVPLVRKGLWSWSTSATTETGWAPLALREELLEEHWSYMDRYAKELIARGPTFADDGETPTGSVHIVDLPDPAAARAFAFDEPNYQAGAYREVLLRRWRNVLGRTMWDFPGGRSGGNRYLVLGLGEGLAADLALPPDQDELIAYGPLLSDDGDMAGYGGAAQGPKPGYGTRRPDSGPVRGHRGPRLGVRRASMNHGGAGAMPSPERIDLGQER